MKYILTKVDACVNCPFLKWQPTKMAHCCVHSFWKESYYQQREFVNNRPVIFILERPIAVEPDQYEKDAQKRWLILETKQKVPFLPFEYMPKWCPLDTKSTIKRKLR
jgi:hypothetical protein